MPAFVLLSAVLLQVTMFRIFGCVCGRFFVTWTDSRLFLSKGRRKRSWGRALVASTSSLPCILNSLWTKTETARKGWGGTMPGIPFATVQHSWLRSDALMCLLWSTPQRAFKLLPQGWSCPWEWCWKTQMNSSFLPEAEAVQLCNQMNPLPSFWAQERVFADQRPRFQPLDIFLLTSAFQKPCEFCLMPGGLPSLLVLLFPRENHCFALPGLFCVGGVLSTCLSNPQTAFLNYHL